MDTLDDQISFRLSKALHEEVRRIAAKERRKPNEVARALLERGVFAYGKDGEVFEPLEDDPFLATSNERMPGYYEQQIAQAKAKREAEEAFQNPTQLPIKQKKRA